MSPLFYCHLKPYVYNMHARLQEGVYKCETWALSIAVVFEFIYFHDVHSLHWINRHFNKCWR